MSLSQPHPQERAFLEAVVENPSDEAPLLVLADWLEEHDDPRRAELLRLHLRLGATCCRPESIPSGPSSRRDWCNCWPRACVPACSSAW
jgi:uncharacterized protein (TIGR02996 family)